MGEGAAVSPNPLAARSAFCNICRSVSQSASPVPSAPAAAPAPPPQSFDRIYAEVRGDAAIQYQAVAPDPPVQTPPWLQALGRAITDFFDRIAPGLNGVWPTIEMLLIVLLVAGIGVLAWKFVWPLMRDYRAAPRVQDEGWMPDEHVARELLSEADALAARGAFAEAAHLLLYRSIEDIERRRPQLLRPSHTAREIGGFDALSQGARETFGVIAGHVERSLFAGQTLGAAGWQEARDAYSRFALRGSWA